MFTDATQQFTLITHDDDSFTLTPTAAYVAFCERYPFTMTETPHAAAERRREATRGLAGHS